LSIIIRNIIRALIIAYTFLYVKDVGKAVNFYQNAFGFARKFITPEGDYGEIVSGKITIAFATTTLAN